MPVSDFLNVQISTAPVAPVQPGFGVMLILGACQHALASFGASLIQYYASTAAMLSAGFLTTDPEYLAAAAAFSQTPAPPTIGVGRRTNLPTQKFTLTLLNAGQAAWQATHAYVAGNTVNNGGNIYVCTVGGTSAGSGGPTGNGVGITDGSVTWAFQMLLTGKVYSVTVNGTLKSYTAIITDTNTTVAASLATSIGTPTGFGAASASLGVITLTASAAGNWCRISATNPGVDMDCQQTHVDAGIAADITAIANADSTWYGIVSVFSSTAEITALAAWTETNGKLYDAGTLDSTTMGSGSGDIFSTLKTSAYVRSPGWYHQDNGAFLDAAIMANRFTYAPGSENWMFVTLAGVAPMNLTSTQVNNLKSKNGNYYYNVGVGITATGITPSGQFIDTVRGRDWQASRLQNRIFALLNNPASAANPSNPNNAVPPLGKIPFTDQGIASIEGEIRAALQEGVTAGFLAANPAPTVTMPKAASLTPTNRSQRTIPNGAFSATIAGAIDNLTLSGVVQF